MPLEIQTRVDRPNKYHTYTEHEHAKDGKDGIYRVLNIGGILELPEELREEGKKTVVVCREPKDSPKTEFIIFLVIMLSCDMSKPVPRSIDVLMLQKMKGTIESKDRVRIPGPGLSVIVKEYYYTGKYEDRHDVFKKFMNFMINEQIDNKSETTIYNCTMFNKVGDEWVRSCC